MKKVLVIHYSQSGQLTDIVKNIVSPLEKMGDDVKVDYYNIEMEKPFPFPWSKPDFFGVFAESYNQVPEPIKDIPLHILNTKYDLVILGYQIWYLTPSIPINSFLSNDNAKTLLKNTPVVTVIGCRNMWVMAQEKMKIKLKLLQANLVGNIVLVDRHVNHISVITIVQWMFTGVKKRFLGIFPMPGVSKNDIDNSVKFGDVIKKHIFKDADFKELQGDLLLEGAVKIKPFLVKVDSKANIIFSKWAKIISSKGDRGSKKRLFWEKIFNYYLLFAIWLISPIVFVLFLLTYLFNLSKIRRDKKYYSSVTLKGS